MSATDPQPYTGPERRRVERPQRIPPTRIGRARVAPGYARLLLGLDPEEWYPVVDRNPDTIPQVAPPGYVWLDVGTRLRSCWAAHLEVEPSG
jgi:hypothetical protein